ncbi:MAG: adenine nucleotide alpha hydrolase family protein [Firmicutes bacterium]|nr:adenine nucleotide alpha hydrolase family protein [Bacillota bacterium]
MKCRVCKGPAFVKFPAHNAAFCEEHFDAFFLRQVTHTIKKYRMLPPGGRVLVALSGGKDSLVTALVLHRLGYNVEGLFIDLGIAEEGFSLGTKKACEDFCKNQGIPLNIFSLQKEFGKSIPEIACRYPRLCAVCGVTKRHIMNRYALAPGFAALATGHTLDDLVARLLANLKQWDLHHLSKGLPVLPGENGFAKKIKPLALQTEDEIKTFARLHGIQPVEARCPYAAEAKFKRYKLVLNGLEQESPGFKRAFYTGYAKNVHRFKDETSRPPLATCSTCGLPSPAPVCTFCRIWREVTADF